MDIFLCIYVLQKYWSRTGDKVILDFLKFQQLDESVSILHSNTS